jgi:uncharacterized protein YbjT (DUF2867 family)
MRVLLFGATGMVGQGVLRECVAAHDVTEVVAIVRSPLERIQAELTEAEYRHVTYDLTIKLAEALVKQSPQAVFVYVSGAGTNAQSKQMWARVKGATENALMAMPFRGVYCFRPGYIQPLHGVKSKVGWYNAAYMAVGWAEPLLMRVAPSFVTTTEAVGRAMLKVARVGWPQKVLGSKEINAAAGAA